MRVSVDLLVALGATRSNAQKYAQFLDEEAQRYAVNTHKRLAAFLAQIFHESGALRWANELWGPTPAQRRYEGRVDLGNTQPGDGFRFRGRGLIQVTGRYNYRKFSERVRQLHPSAPDFEAEPDKLAEPKWAVVSAFEYWDRHRLNALADVDDFRKITIKINGGLNGYDDRIRYWEKAKALLPFIDEEQQMPAPLLLAAASPFVTAAAKAVVEAVPALLDHYGKDSEKVAKHAPAAKVIVDVAKNALGAVNEQEVVEKIQNEPAAKEKLEAAVRDSWYEITEAGGGGIAGARRANEAYMLPDGPRFWINPAFWISIVLLLMPFMLVIDTLFVHPENYSGEIRTQIVTAVLVVISMVGAYWIGTSISSARKTELMSKER